MKKMKKVGNIVDIKKTLRNFLVNIGTSGKYSGKYAEKNKFGMSDYLIRYVALNFISITGSIVLIGFLLLRGSKWQFGTIVACTCMLIVAIMTIILSRAKKIQQLIPATLLMISYGLLCLIVTYSGEAHGSNFLFVYVYPPLTIMMLGMRNGIIFSTALLVLMSIAMIVPGMSLYSYPLTVPVHMIITYLLAFSVMVVVEATRKIKDRMIEGQNRMMKKLKDEAEKANRTKSNFLASMSHDIRTPMNAISGMAELLLRTDIPPEARDYAQDIKQASSNLISIINDILDLTKIEAGRLELIPVNYTLASVISDTVRIIRMRLMEKDVQFLTNIDENIPDNLVGDEMRMRQIILNLLSNAVKFTSKGYISMSVTLERIEGERVWLRIVISDTGCGIAPEDQEKLFDDFTRLNIKKNRNIEGSGLGLAIVKKLCYAMSGEIGVQSEYGKGSVFTAIIPQDIASNESSAMAGKADKANTLDEKIDSKDRHESSDTFDTIQFTAPQARILVVDDITTNLKVAEGLLSLYGMTVDICLSSVEAVDLVKHQNYDIVFMDHVMPVMDGIEATAAIRAWENENQTKKIPIIALTANAISGMPEMFLQSGFNDFLAKPINISRLDEILTRWLPKEKMVMEPQEDAAL